MRYSGTMKPQGGLRERHKQRTRETIARVAYDLFATKGYQATTLPEIAEAADVSTRTIFAYYPSKEEILFSDLTKTRDALAERLAERPANEDTLEAVREFVLSSEWMQLREHLHLCVSKDPELRGRLRARIGQFETVIAPAIAHDTGVSEDDPNARLVAASLTAAFNLLAEQGAGKERLWTSEEMAAQMDAIFTFLRGGLEALRRPRGGRRS